MYQIGDAQRLAALDKLSAWLDRGDVKRLLVDRIGRGGRQNLIRGSEIYPEHIEHMPEPREQAILDQVLMAHGDVGGTIQLRCEFDAPEGGSPPSPQRFRIGLTRTGPGSNTGSKGTDAAAEALSSSIASMTDQLRRSHDDLSGRFVDALQEHSKAQGAGFEDRLSMLHGYNAEILRLQLQVTELRSDLRFAELASQGSDPSEWAALLRELLPVAGAALEGLVGAFKGQGPLGLPQAPTEAPPPPPPVGPAPGQVPPQPVP